MLHYNSSLYYVFLPRTQTRKTARRHPDIFDASLRTIKQNQQSSDTYRKFSDVLTMRYNYNSNILIEADSIFFNRQFAEDIIMLFAPHFALYHFKTILCSPAQRGLTISETVPASNPGAVELFEVTQTETVA